MKPLTKVDLLELVHLANKKIANLEGDSGDE
jgi:hypothetical protein